MFRDGVFKTKAAVTLYEHLHDILPVMKQDEQFRTLFASLKSTPENFENIDWLCARPKHSFRRNLAADAERV
jgi:hypothetical protein